MCFRNLCLIVLVSLTACGKITPGTGDAGMDDGDLPDGEPPCEPTKLVGSGKSDDPFLVCAGAHLALIGDDAELLAASYRVTHDFDVAGMALVIGPANPSLFTGVLDGGGHTISNLTLGDGMASAGLFSHIGNGGVVRDLVLDNVAISGGGTNGALAVRNDGNIENVTVNGSIDGSSFTGMLVGLNTGIVDGCSSSGSVGTGNHMGGLVGSNSGTVTRSFSTATVAATNRVGGLVGTNDGNVRQSFATGRVDGALFVGGLVGTLRGAGTIEDSFSKCELVNSQNGPSGGLVGNSEADPNVGGVSVKNSYAACQTIGNVRGGLIGEVSQGTTVVESFWDLSLTNIGTVGVGKSRAQMQDAATFMAWDFATPVWKFDSQISTFPVLAWQKR